MRIITELGGDPVAVHDVVALLDQPTRYGLRPLPLPLPLVPSIQARYGGLELDARDRDLLLAVSLCLGDELEPLLEFDGRIADELMLSAVGPLLALRAGRVRYVDPMLDIWVRSTADAAAEASVHERLVAIFAARGDAVSADWHRSRASLRGLPDAAPELTRIARELSEAGHPARGLQLAGEAASHAVGVDLDEARLVSGASAIAAGHAAEAVAWLGPLFPDGSEKYRLQGLSALVVAQAHLQGAVPAIDPDSFRPSTDDADDWYSWTRAAAFASMLCAERGDRKGMRVWLAALREGAARVGAERELRDPVVALSWLLVGEPDVDAAEGTGPMSGSVLGALHAASRGDLDTGLRLLAVADSGLGVVVDPFVAGFEHSPVVGAYRAIAEVLLLTWRGEIRTARDRLLHAAMELPVSVPFAGLGVVLARRLDLAVLGRIGPFGEALTAVLPPAVRLDQLVDRAIEAHLSGSFEEASSFMKLWRDRGSPGTIVAVPGLDEMAAVVPDAGSSTPVVAPPELLEARRLRARIATTTDARWRTVQDEVVAASRALVSPFARGRVEAMIGILAVVRNDLRAASEHLRAAARLFDLAGADAWARMAGERLARVEEETAGAASANETLATCRRVWEPLLTSRELEVAMMAVAGSSNREISDALALSVRTVEVHLGRVFAKLDVRNRVELTVLAHRTEQYL
ncbi:helix-turn-helix transcriptional regulator [Microbacterium sp.]|uniref:helix-turn-helix transcriptional regulator n=1 Tax=Microbacterium sp. TaxID=51671 RepID=UPI0039E26B56